MSADELARALMLAPKKWVVRVGNGTSERPDLFKVHRTRASAEKRAHKLRLDGYPAKAEVFLGK